MVRISKKADLRINIPSYSHDYVEMPPQTRRLILEANRMPNDIQFIDDEDTGVGPSRNTDPGVISPALESVKFEEFRSSTPEIKITEAEDTNEREVRKALKTKSVRLIESENAAASRPLLKRNSISAPDGLGKNELEALRKIYDENVSVDDLLS